MRKLVYPAAALLLGGLLAVPVLVFQKEIPSEAAVVPAAKVRGPVAAPVTIAEYSDFQCPSCRVVQPVVSEILAKFPGRVRLLFRHFPLRGHPNSPLAHQSAECAAEQGKFWEYHDRLYQDQAVWSPLPDPLAAFLQFAAELGLDSERFGRCLESPAAAERIQADYASGKSAGVQSTPTFLIGNRMLVGSKQFFEQADGLIRGELEKTGKK
ncbi:MAG: DsbA family protein [Candidatus Omnitrophica bacterium]|nr:DsbA family protein [Candidatus Omnitrophota bacterium]